MRKQLLGPIRKLGQSRRFRLRGKGCVSHGFSDERIVYHRPRFPLAPDKEIVGHDP